jgi:DNA topoisomerase VI subunit B
MIKYKKCVLRAICYNAESKFYKADKRSKQMKKNYVFKLKLNEEMAKKLSCVSKSEGLTIQNMLNQLIRQKIQYFERVKGNIQKSTLAEAELLDFEIEEQ